VAIGIHVLFRPLEAGLDQMRLDSDLHGHRSM